MHANFKEVDLDNVGTYEQRFHLKEKALTGVKLSWQGTIVPFE